MFAIAEQQVRVNFEVVHQLTEVQVQDLCDLFQSTWWAKNRCLDDVQQMLKHSNIMVGICDEQTKALVGFARVLSDSVYRAILMDVVVREDYRDRGLGRVLMDAVIHHPDLQTVEVLALFCLPEVIPFYEKWGFTTEPKNLKLMVRSNYLMNC
jgi:N-acetylglutamate synthase-like GNAT family acetyltransferase